MPIKARFILAMVALPLTLPAFAQTVNHSFSAMDQGDYQAAFQALRRLEQAGDPEAARLLGDIFGTPSAIAPATPAPAPPAPAVTVAAAAAPQALPIAPEGSPRPLARPSLAILPERPQATQSGLPAPLGDSDFRALDALLADIGRDLFFDPILSGNKDISCATCHHPQLASGDGVSLGLGTGARGLGHARVATGPNAADRRIPRNAPALWNLGARELRVLFHDGRVETDPDTPSALLTPQGPLDYMSLNSVLAAQALFPPLSHEEMAGRAGENNIADAVTEERIHGDDGAWGLLAARVDAIDSYRARFDAYRGVGEVRIDEIANALAAFIEWEFRAINSPFDQYLREEAALSPDAGEGMRLFFGKGNCASCHSGPLLSDQQFHAMGQPPIGPGKAQDGDGYTRDIGRAAITLDEDDSYAFRTPMLRNVTKTGPWGHAGAFSYLRDFLRHHLDPVAGLTTYEPQALLPQLASANDDYDPLDNTHLLAEIREAAARAMTQRPLVVLEEDELGFLIAFLDALSDESENDMRLGVPETVPSGLPVER